MDKLETLLREIFTIDLVDIVISGARATCEATKIRIRPVILKDSLLFQASRFVGKQVFHSNMTEDEAVVLVGDWLLHDYKQAQIKTKQTQISVLVSKKGQVTIRSKQMACCQTADLSHNRSKKYIIEEGRPVPFMQDLGVMTQEGKIVRTKYDKFRQINRFLEFVEDILPALDKHRRLTIIDFGCGKSYLTFAIYYYLHILKQYDIHIIGLDLKEDVIAHCQKLTEKYGYTELEFICGDIAEFTGVDKVDMVVTLHACDTATDFALNKAVTWQADVILSVPCCQHELNGQISCDILEPVFRYGLIKERTAALMTDGLRGQLLEMSGYKTQLLEFIDMAHTPKNILIRAVRAKESISEEQQDILTAEYIRCRDFLKVSPTLEHLLFPEMTEGMHA